MRRILLLALGSFALGLDAYVMAGLLPVVAGDLHVSASAAGQMVTVFTLCYALAAPVFATVLAGRPARVILSLALTVFTLANALSAVSTSLTMLLIARAVAGIGAGVYSPLAAATAASLSPAERRGRGLAIVAYGIATVIFVLLIASEAVLPGVAATHWGLILPLIVWGASGWALQVPQQHELIAAEPEHSAVAVSLNSSAVYLGSATGSALGGLVLVSGVAPAGLPYCTAGVALVALVLHLTLVRWGRKRPRPVSARRTAPVTEAKTEVSA
ncbi:MFS transporter [Streptomyces chattanoogensis]|uniref:MFS transporter n=1 Tax=Streptomyces chattanoogensis TaxID=66876 RepID=UPI0006B519CE|nr:MFS transporter [Streptomyces chattanoogensis]